MFTSTPNLVAVGKGKKPPLISEQRTVSFHTFTYLINEYASFSYSRTKENMLERLGEDVGARLYEGLFFANVKTDTKKAERRIKVLDVLNYVKQDLWTMLFDKPASGLESFIGERRHSVNGQELKEYVVYDLSPQYNLRYSRENFTFKFFAGVLKGFLTYAGFPCKVVTDTAEDKSKGKTKCEFIVFFEESVFDKE